MTTRAWWVGVAATALLVACSSDPPSSSGGGGGLDVGPGDTNPPDVGPDGTGDDTTPGECVDTDGDGFGPGCAAGPDCAPDDPTRYPGATEVCGDGVDNNCDGRIDESCACTNGAIEPCYEGPDGTSDVGICRTGYRTCVDEAWGSCEFAVLPTGADENSCDGADNDCDGRVDEGLTNACGGCGPTPLDGPPGFCDGLDNDCDGFIDQGCDCDERTNQPCYPGPPLTLGKGQCRGGTFDCEGEGWGPCLGAILPTAEVCNGLDDDCDGLVDEGTRNACGDCGLAAPDELCDDVDNDCDGRVDEGVRLTCGLCAADVGAEVCGDGFDNDCDGQVDENCACNTGSAVCYPGPASAAGVGACVAGSRECPGGEFWGPCTGFVLPTIEICDGVDNDCDGFVDLDARGCSVCGTTAELCDGVDNDCDGVVDEGVRNTCGTCFDEVVPEEDGGNALCNGLDDDCDGLIDESLLNACGTCGDSCYVRTYDDAGDWQGGTLEGIDEDTLDEGLRLGRARFTFPDLWVANSAANTVTRINTNPPVSVVDTYPVGISPSRTAVDFNGDVWVANRAFSNQGTVTKIRSQGCTGVECIAFTVDVGTGVQLPRALAIDRDGFAWVGTYNDGFLRRLHPDTGAVVESHATGLNIYGIAIDTEGIIWIATISNQGIGAFDTTTNTMLGNWRVPGCSAPYGIAVDGDGNVWFGNWSCNNMGRLDRAAFDRDRTVNFTSYTATGFNNARGVAVDGDGFIYFAASGSNRVHKFDPTTNTFVWSAPTCNQPIGIGIASDGNLWTMCLSSNQAQRFSPDGVLLDTLPTGSQPYSYSDMTGFQLRNFTAPRGIWRGTFDCGRAVCNFDELRFAAVAPPGTAVTARARTSPDNATWSEWSTAATTSPADIRALPAGRYCQVEVNLTTTSNDLTPTVSSVDVYWQRP